MNKNELGIGFFNGSKILPCVALGLLASLALFGIVAVSALVALYVGGFIPLLHTAMIVLLCLVAPTAVLATVIYKTIFDDDTDTTPASDDEVDRHIRLVVGDKGKTILR